MCPYIVRHVWITRVGNCTSLGGREEIKRNIFTFKRFEDVVIEIIEFLGNERVSRWMMHSK